MTAGGYNSVSVIPEDKIEMILTLANQGFMNYSQISKKVGISDKTVKNILKRYDIEIKNKTTNNKGNVNNLKKSWGKHNDNLKPACKVYVVELNKTFNSLTECANFLIKEGYSKTKNQFYVMKSISRSLSSKDYKRKTYLGFHLEKL